MEEIKRNIVEIKHILKGHSKKLAAHDKKFEAHDKRFDAIEKRLDTHDRKFDTISSELHRQGILAEKRDDTIKQLYEAVMLINEKLESPPTKKEVSSKLENHENRIFTLEDNIEKFKVNYSL